MSSYGYLAHHGVKGQKWGVRRYQNSDGTLTTEGRARYGISDARGINGGVSPKDFNYDLKRAFRNVAIERNNDLYNVKHDKNLSDEQKQKAIKEIRDTYKTSGKVIMDTFNKQYGEQTVKSIQRFNRIRLATGAISAVALMTIGGKIVSNTIDDFDIVKKHDNETTARWYGHQPLYGYKPSEVLGYELFNI